MVAPDYYRDGKFHDPKNPGTMEFLKDQSQWSKLKEDFEGKVLPFVQGKGATSFGAIGTCWGSYMVSKEVLPPPILDHVGQTPWLAMAWYTLVWLGWVNVCWEGGGGSFKRECVF